jgi:hypothetical protein
MFRRPLMLCEGLERGPARRAVLDLLQGARDPQLALATGDRRWTSSFSSDRLGDGDWRSGY